MLVGMVRKAKRKRETSTEWGVGQPLAFPSKKSAAAINRVTQEVIEEAMQGPFSSKRQKRKKK
jgi:hypothetical protein